MTNVPIPGGGAPAPSHATRRDTRFRFFASVAVLAVGGVMLSLLALGQPWRLTPDTTGATVRSVVAMLLMFVVVVPAFAVFQYDRAVVGAAWHEPVWRPTTIGLVGLAVALVTTMGWHGLRLAFYIARVWTGGP